MKVQDDVNRPFRYNTSLALQARTDPDHVLDNVLENVLDNVLDNLLENRGWI